MSTEISNELTSELHTHEHKFDNKIFIVTPIYQRNSSTSIFDLMLNLMKTETEKH